MRTSGRVGVDVGGTFTDIVSVVEGKVTSDKVPSTPDAPEDAICAALDDSPAIPASISSLVHGTTVATNAMLEQEWAPTALITTEGFRDVLEIGRQSRQSLYDLHIDAVDPIVPRDRRFEVPERVDKQGRIIRSLDREAVQACVEAIVESSIESVAISLLFAFENDAHEQAIESIIHDCDPTISISRSSQVHPEIREYERTLVTAVNAALKPIMDDYLGQLENHLTHRDEEAGLQIMQSNGGIISAREARTLPVKTVLSGPAAGVQGANWIASRGGYADVITMDMGGTSCDVSVITDGNPIISTDGSVGDYPIPLPMVDITTIGAGGGSIGWIDSGGALRVGPNSAGAYPGPISYGRGGSTPTVTDAHVLLGRIDPAQFLASPADGDATVSDIIDEEIATPLGIDIEEAAQGILDIANANMERALRVVTVERGLDPRSFTLVAFGGAGPLHAPAIAQSLEIPRVLIPKQAGVLSALGLLLSDLIVESSTSMVRDWDELSPEHLEETFRELETDGHARLRTDDSSIEQRITERRVEVRYAGQSYTLPVSITAPIDNAELSAVERRFHEQHNRRYGYSSPGEPLELVTVRSKIVGTVRAPDLNATESFQSHRPAVKFRRNVVFGGEEYRCPIYARSELEPGHIVAGPAIIEGSESTIVIHPEQRGTVDGFETIEIVNERAGQ